MNKKRVILVGAAGRDFHNFNMLFRENEAYSVVAFTATQIPDIEDRSYPPELAGPLYPEGIPIFPQSELKRLIKENDVDEVIFSYSDVSHTEVMQVGSLTLSSGARFILPSPRETMICSKKPVVSVCAVRTGCGKSQTTRYIAEILTKLGKKVVAIRHPMPYGNLNDQVVQRFASKADLDKFHCTIEEMEEYEPHIEEGRVIYAGVDYARIVEQAEQEADIILWDGGNNDTSFIKPDIEVVVTDPHRPGHELLYHPGQANFISADIIIINKVDSATPTGIYQIEENLKNHNPGALIVKANSKLTADNPEQISGKRVLVVEDGPTLTHGEMTYGAGVIAAGRFEASEIIDPRPWIVGTIRETFEKYPGIGSLLPAMGYGQKQMKDLETTINNTDCDTVIIATPIDLNRIITIEKPTVRVSYSLEEIEKELPLAAVLSEWVKNGMKKS